MTHSKQFTLTPETATHFIDSTFAFLKAKNPKKYPKKSAIKELAAMLMNYDDVNQLLQVLKGGGETNAASLALEARLKAHPGIIQKRFDCPLKLFQYIKRHPTNYVARVWQDDEALSLWENEVYFSNDQIALIKCLVNWDGQYVECFIDEELTQKRFYPSFASCFLDDIGNTPLFLTNTDDISEAEQNSWFEWLLDNMWDTSFFIDSLSKAHDYVQDWLSEDYTKKVFASKGDETVLMALFEKYKDALTFEQRRNCILKTGNIEAAKLIESRYGLGKKDVSAISCAAESGHYSLLEYLLEQGFCLEDVLIPNKEFDYYSVFHFEAALETTLEHRQTQLIFYQTLFHFGISPNTLTDDGDSLLHLAAGDPYFCLELIKLGVDDSIKNNDGKTWRDIHHEIDENVFAPSVA